MKYIAIITFLLLGSTVAAQGGGAFGVRAGLNYGSTSDYVDSAQSAVENPDDNLGYHFGLFAKLDLGPLYLRPELLYTQLYSDYSEARLSSQQIDAPILLGINIFGPVNIYAGPSLRYILDSELEKNDRLGPEFDFDDIEDRFTVGGQIGVSVYFANLEVGLRYDRSFQDNIAEFAVDNGVSNVRVDNRAEQIILALSLQL